MKKFEAIRRKKRNRRKSSSAFCRFLKYEAFFCVGNQKSEAIFILEVSPPILTLDRKNSSELFHLSFFALQANRRFACKAKKET
jgi:hypothetical protein